MSSKSKGRKFELINKSDFIDLNYHSIKRIDFQFAITKHLKPITLHLTDKFISKNNLMRDKQLTILLKKLIICFKPSTLRD